jgi:histidinol dehydrogenase
MMPLRLDSRDPGFGPAFTALVDGRREADADVSRDVAAIIARVRAEGDAAIANFTKRFDRHDLDASDWRIDTAQCRAALDALDPDLRASLELAAERIRAYHAAQRPSDSDMVDAAGVRMGARWTAIAAAGL